MTRKVAPSPGTSERRIVESHGGDFLAKPVERPRACLTRMAASWKPSPAAEPRHRTPLQDSTFASLVWMSPDLSCTSTVRFSRPRCLVIDGYFFLGT